jgi:hypothetical protein
MYFHVYLIKYSPKQEVIHMKIINIKGGIILCYTHNFRELSLFKLFNIWLNHKNEKISVILEQT